MNSMLEWTASTVEWNINNRGVEYAIVEGDNST